MHRKHLFVLAPANDGDIDSDLQNAVSSLRCELTTQFSKYPKCVSYIVSNNCLWIAKGVVSEYRRPEVATVLPNDPPSTDSDSEYVEDEYPDSEDSYTTNQFYTIHDP